MNKENVLLLIKLKYNKFTKSQKKLADFIMTSPSFILNKSISEVAVKCHIAEATISRFCKALGFKGYIDFKLSIARDYSYDEDSNEIHGDIIEEEDPVLTVAKRILSKNVEALNETYKMIKENDINTAVKYMINANRIIFFGVGSSYISALEGCNNFMRITPKVSISSESHMQFLSASLLTSKDVGIIISYTGSTKEIVEIARIAKGNGAKIICLTHFLKSPLTNFSDVVLISSSNERLYLGYSLSVEIAQLYLLDMLYTEYFRRTYNESKNNKEISESSLVDKMY